MCSIADLEEQILELLADGDNHNDRLWPALVNPLPIMQRPMPNMWDIDTTEEIQIAIQNMLPSWMMTKGCFQRLEEHTGPEPMYDTSPMSSGFEEEVEDLQDDEDFEGDGDDDQDD